MHTHRLSFALLLSFAFCTTTSHAQQAGDNTPPATEKVVPVKGLTQPGPEDTLPACPSQDPTEAKKYPDKKIKPPRLLQAVEARFSKEARKKRISGESIIQLTVDTNGVPTNLCLAKPLGYGLDEQAALAIRQYKFSPATDDGKAVPVRISVEVKFRLFKRFF